MVQKAKSETEKDCSLALVEKLRETADPTERQTLKQQLARMTFGE
jgi:hypothetical protein